MKQLIILVVPVLLVGCTVTNDPSKGGLIGYMATGEKGYQKRIDERTGRLQTVQQQNLAMQGQARKLEMDRDAIKAELKRQQDLLKQLDNDVAQLQQECQKLKTSTAKQEQEKKKLMQQMGAMQQSVTQLDQDDTLLVEEKKKKLEALQAELKLMRERASLLTTL